MEQTRIPPNYDAYAAVHESAITVYGYREHVAAGGLVSYGVDLRWCYRHSAYFVAKILRGAKAGDLPTEFPANLWLAVIFERQNR